MSKGAGGKVTGEDILFDESVVVDFVKNIPAGVAFYHCPSEDPEDLTLVHCNDHASKEAGHDLTPFLGQKLKALSPRAFWPIHGQPSIAQNYVMARQSGAPHVMLVHDMSESLSDQRFVAHFVPCGSEHVASVFENVTETRRLEDELDRVATLFQGTFAQAPLGIAHVDTSCQVIECNEYLCRLLGYTPEELKGTKLTSLMKPADAAAYRRLIEGLMEEHTTPGSTELPLRCKDGSLRWVRRATKGQRTSSGALQVFIVMIEDMTRERQHLSTIEQQMAELTRANKELNDFTYIASHDLRSPLQGISHVAQWLMEDALELLPEKSQRHLKLIQERVERLDLLLEDLLQYSRIGRKDYKFGKIDIKKMFQALVQLSGSKEPFDVEYIVEVPTVRLPKVPLRHVLHNLISNAIEHHDNPPGKLWLTAKEEGDEYVFLVRDNGPGIPEKHHQRIFRIFQSLSSEHHRSHSGVGLAIVKKTVDFYQGSLQLESTEGEGTTFLVRWPKDPVEPEAYD